MSVPAGEGVENSFEFIPETHVEHVIPFIENYGMNAVRPEGSPVHVVRVLPGVPTTMTHRP
jgi:hypothetical protein